MAIYYFLRAFCDKPVLKLAIQSGCPSVKKAIKGSCKKSSSLNGGQLRDGGGVTDGDGGPLGKKISFFFTFFSKDPTFQRPLSSRGVGLNGPTIKRRIFFTASLLRRMTLYLVDEMVIVKQAYLLITGIKERVNIFFRFFFSRT